MALKEVFQHSIALSDIDPELTGVTRKQVWDALKTAYLNRHEYQIGRASCRERGCLYV